MNDHPLTFASSRASVLATLAGATLKLLAAAFTLGLLLYLLAVAWLHHHLAGQAIGIAQAAGLPADAERSLGGLLTWLLAFALVPALLGLVAESLKPGRDKRKVIGQLLLLVAISLAAVLLPHGLRSVRGVDARGLPIHLEPSDPAAARWWNADGDPVLFHSVEGDGRLRFWNRPGVTPDTGLPSHAVTREVRLQWERARAAKIALDAEQTRQRETEDAAKEASETARHEAAVVENGLRVKALQESQRASQAQQARLAEIEAKSQAEIAQLRQQAEKLEEFLRKQQEEKPPRALPVSTREVTASHIQPTPSAWTKRRMLPGKFLQVSGGVARSTIEIHSSGPGRFHAPGSPPIRFSAGRHSFYTPEHHFRLVCDSPSAFDISYRWILR